MASIIISWDNYETELPEKHHSTFRKYATTPTYTGTNGEIWYDDERGILVPMSDTAMEMHGIKPYVCEPHDLDDQDEDSDF